MADTMADWHRAQAEAEIAKYRAAHDAVQQAYDEVKAAPPVEYPSTWSVVANHPGVAGYQVMSDPEYQQAVKYDKLMRRLRDIQREHGGLATRESPLFMALTNGSPEPIRDRSFWARQWGTPEPSGDKPLPPYRHRGVLATGQPLRNAFEAYTIPFSAVANTFVRPTYDLDKAAKAAPEVANKTFLGVPRAVRALADPSYKGEINKLWANERKFAESVPFDDPLMAYTQGDPAQWFRESTARAGATDQGVVDGTTVLEELGYPDHWSRNLAGMALEIPLDPMSGMAAMAKNAGRLGRFASPAAKRAAVGGIARGLGSELAPAAGMTAFMEALRRASQREPSLESLVQ